MPLSYTTPYTVQTYDIDKRRRMTVAALVKEMQETAMQNVMEMKVSVWDMEAQNISWVLLRKNLRINRLPVDFAFANRHLPWSGTRYRDFGALNISAPFRWALRLAGLLSDDAAAPTLRVP